MSATVNTHAEETTTPNNFDEGWWKKGTDKLSLSSLFSWPLFVFSYLSYLFLGWVFRLLCFSIRPDRRQIYGTIKDSKGQKASGCYVYTQRPLQHSMHEMCFFFHRHIRAELWRNNAGKDRINYCHTKPTCVLLTALLLLYSNGRICVYICHL